MRRPHSHDAEYTPRPRLALVEETPLFRPTELSEPAFIAKWLRGCAAYHEAHGGPVTLGAEMCRALTRLGVTLELTPRGTDLGDCTPAQAERYADELERAHASS